MKVKNDKKVSVNVFDEAAATKEVQEELLNYYQDIILKDLEQKVALRRAQWEEEQRRQAQTTELFPETQSQREKRDTIRPLKQLFNRGRDMRGTLRSYPVNKGKRVPCIALEVVPYKGYCQKMGYRRGAVGYLELSNYGFSAEQHEALARFAHDYLDLIKGGLSWIMNTNRELEKLYGEEDNINKSNH